MRFLSMYAMSESRVFKQNENRSLNGNTVNHKYTFTMITSSTYCIIHPLNTLIKHSYNYTTYLFQHP